MVNDKLNDEKQKVYLKEYFEFLDELRNSGHTNMFGSVPYVQSRFGLGEAEATDIVLDWMMTFDDRLERGEVSDKKLKVTERRSIHFSYEDEEDECD